MTKEEKFNLFKQVEPMIEQIWEMMKASGIEFNNVTLSKSISDLGEFTNLRTSTKEAYVEYDVSHIDKKHMVSYVSGGGIE